MIEKVMKRFRGGESSRFARDAIFLQIASAVTMGANIATSIVTFRVLGAYGYGQFAEAYNIYTLLYFIGNVGFSQLTIARVSEAVGKQDPEELTRWLGFFAKAFGAFSVIFVLAGAGLGPVLGRAILDDSEVGLWASIICLSGPISLPFYLVQCALTGTRRMRVLAEMENLKEIVRAFFIISLTIGVGDPRGTVLGELAGALFSVPLAWFAYWKGRAESGMELPTLRLILKYAMKTRWAQVGELAKVGSLISINKNLQAIIPTVLPRLILGHYSNSREVGYLNLAQNLMKIPLIGLQGVSRTLMPTLGELRGAGRLDRLRSVLSRIMLLSGGIVTIGTAAWGLALYWVIPRFYGESARPALDLIWWLFLSCAVAGFAVGLEAFFLVVDRIKVAIFINTVFIAVSLPLAFPLIENYTSRGAAAYVALVHGSIIVSFVYVFSYFKRHGTGLPGSKSGSGDGSQTEG